MAPYSVLFRNITMEELEEMSYRELQQRCKSLHLPANFKKIYLIKLIYEKINGREEQVTRIINQAKYERLQAASNRKKRVDKFSTSTVISTNERSPPMSVTPKKVPDTHSIRPITLNMSERVLRNRMESTRYNQSNSLINGTGKNQNEMPKIRFRPSGPRCTGIIVPRKLRRTGILEYKEQLKTFQPIIFAHKSEIQMLCKNKSSMEIVLRPVHSKLTPSKNNLEDGHQIIDKKVIVLPSVVPEQTVDNVNVSSELLPNTTNHDSQTRLTTISDQCNNDPNRNGDSSRNENNIMEYRNMINYPNLQATFGEPSVTSPRSSNCLTSIQVRSLNECTPVCNNIRNNYAQTETPVTTCSFMVDYFGNFKKSQLDIYFNLNSINTFRSIITKQTIMNKNGLFYTGTIGGLVTPTSTLPCQPIVTADLTANRPSCCWDVQLLQPHDIMLYQPRDINRENLGITRNPLCILASQVAAITEVQNNMDDVLEVISQDGDYLSRLGMNIKVKCVFCAWESMKIQFDNHLRKEHSNLVLAYNTPEWIISFNLEKLINKEDWSSILVQDNLGFLYIVSGKLHKLDHIMVSVAAVTSEQENKEVSITAYSKETLETCTWLGVVHDFTAIDLNDVNNHIKIELSKLDISLNTIYHQQLVIYSPCENLNTNVILYIKV